MRDLRRSNAGGTNSKLADVLRVGRSEKPAAKWAAVPFATVLLLLLFLCCASAVICDSQSQAASAPFRVRHIGSFNGPDDFSWTPSPKAEKALEILAGRSEPEPSMTDHAMKRPVAIAMNQEARLFVGDQGTVIVHVFDFRQHHYSQINIGLLAPGKRGVQGIGAMAVDDPETLYVTDPRTGNVFVFNTSGKFRGYLHGGREAEAYFAAPLGIAVDRAAGYIYVCDRDRDMVIKLDRSGEVLQTFGVRGGGSGPGEFRHPTQIAISGGELFVVDSGNGRVQHLTPDGKFLSQFNAGDVTGSIAIDRERRILVAQPRLHRIAVYTPDGHYLAAFDNGAKEGENPLDPQALWMQSGHCLYVANATFKRVDVFDIGSSSEDDCHL